MLEKAAEEKDDVKRKQQDIVEIQKTIAAAVQAKEEEDRRIVELQEKKEALSADHKEFFEKRDQLSDQISLMDKECFRLNSQKEKLEETKEAQTSYLWEEYEVTPGHAREFQMEEIPERSELKRRVLEVKDAIRKLGSVNVNAIEEYKEISERHAFLDAQHTDLVKAAETLQGIIDELDGLPLHQKLEQWKHEGCHFLVANAVEAEPYASSAWSLLLHQSEQVNSGLWLAAQTIGAAGSHIAVQASRKARQELPPSLDGRLFFVKSGYPVTALTHAGHDIRVGVIGVQACLALHRAVTLHEHHHYATITVTGDAIEHPQNVRAPFGTPVGELLRFCGIKTGVSQIVMGDALTGVAIDSAVLPVLPAPIWAAQPVRALPPMTAW